MKTHWFKRIGWFHCPTSIPGVLIALVTLGFCVQIFLAVDRRSHSVSDTFYGIFPFWACAFMLFDWVGSRATAAAN